MPHAPCPETPARAHPPRALGQRAAAGHPGRERSADSRRGAPYGWYPFQGVPPPERARLGEWLAGARHWHFAFGWFFVLNGLCYVAWSLFGGYDPARAVHLGVLALLALFTVGHVVMVVLHPRTLGEMVTGGRRHE